jgi:hypothetical protein
MILQLKPPLPMICEKGTGMAHFLIDYGMEHHLYWTIFLDSDGSSWTLPNTKVKMQFNQTIGRIQNK